MASEPLFFVLEPESDGPYDTDCLNEMGFKVGDAPRCPRCGGYVGGLDLLPPVRVELELYGRSPGDFTQTPGGDVVVSERFADAFRSAQLTGAVGFEPVGSSRSPGTSKRLIRPMGFRCWKRTGSNSRTDAPGSACSPRPGVRVVPHSRGAAPDTSVRGGAWFASGQNAAPLARFPGELWLAEIAVCSTLGAPAVASGFRFIDTPSVPDSELE